MDQTCVTDCIEPNVTHMGHFNQFKFMFLNIGPNVSHMDQTCVTDCIDPNVTHIDQMCVTTIGLNSFLLI